MGVEDRVRRGLREIPPADPSGAYERVVEKRVRRAFVRRVQRITLVVLVVVGSAAGYVTLVRSFAGRTTPAGGVASGILVSDNQQDLDWDVFLIRPDASGEVRLTSGSTDDASAAWSPDGTRIAFARYDERTDDSDLYLMNADGTGVERLTDTPDVSEARPRWSPDGTRVAFEGGPDGQTGVWVIGVDGGGATRLTDPAMEAGSPDWSPDGTQIVFGASATVGMLTDEPTPREEIWVMNADGSDPHPVIATPPGEPVDDYEPRWSPDGSRIAFVRGRDVYVVDVDGTGLTNLTPSRSVDRDFYDRGPDWSSDGSHIVFASDRPAGDDVMRLFVMNADGSEMRLLSEHRFGFCCPEPDWIGDLRSPTPVTTDTVQPTTTETTEPGTDIGLSFKLCDVRTFEGIDLLGDGTEGTAWTGAPVTDAGRCPKEADDTYVVAVDLTGDGVADDAWRALPSCFMCEPYAAGDLDGDGDDELVVLESGGTTPRFDLFDVRATGGELRLRPIVVGAEGAAAAGFPPGQMMHLVTGGDEGFSGFIACRNGPSRPEIWVGWADGPVDGPGSDVREVHIVRFIVENAEAHVLDAESFTHPADGPLPYPFGTDNVACGVDWNPF